MKIYNNYNTCTASTKCDSSCDSICTSTPCVFNISEETLQNQNFRTILWTGCHMQVTVMCIPPCGEIGLEVHPDTEQFLRIEHGCGIVKMGDCKDNLYCEKCVSSGYAICIPAGTWHNVINTTNYPLKLYSIYSPPHHPRNEECKSKR